MKEVIDWKKEEQARWQRQSEVFNEQKGFGFIEKDEGRRVRAPQRHSGFWLQTLSEGQR
jgi:cold shock CspA family protein